LFSGNAQGRVLSGASLIMLALAARVPFISVGISARMGIGGL